MNVNLTIENSVLVVITIMSAITPAYGLMVTYQANLINSFHTSVLYVSIFIPVSAVAYGLLLWWLDRSAEDPVIEIEKLDY